MCTMRLGYSAVPTEVIPAVEGNEYSLVVAANDEDGAATALVNVVHYLGYLHGQEDFSRT